MAVASVGVSADCSATMSSRTPARLSQSGLCTSAAANHLPLSQPHSSSHDPDAKSALLRAAPNMITTPGQPHTPL